MKNNIIPIAFAFDNNLAMPASVCIYSLLSHANKDTFYDIYILHSEDEELNKIYIEKVVDFFDNSKVSYRKVGDSFKKSYEIRGITTPAYYRLLIPELIPEYDKIIYSDVDIIYKQDLWSVYSQDLGNNYIAATYDLSLCLSSDGVKYVRTLPGLEQGNYIQSGFIILNSFELRCHDVVSVFKKFSTEKLKYQDQDILNIVCKDRIKILPYFYNMTVYTFQLMAENSSQLTYKYKLTTELYNRNNCTIHYNGQKPWKGVCVNFDVWWEYYRKSPIYDETYYFNYFYNKLNEYDNLSLLKRLKILIRYFFV